MKYVGTKDDVRELATQSDVGGVFTSPNELIGTVDGHLWYDTDDESGDIYNWGPIEQWNSGRNYFATSPVSIVIYQGATYAALVDNLNVVPSSDPTKWAKVSAKGDDSVIPGPTGAKGDTGNTGPAGPAGTATAIVQSTDPQPRPIGSIWVDLAGSDDFTEQDSYIHIAQKVLRGGGRHYVGTAGIAWMGKFNTLGAGRRSNLAPSGYHEIAMPALGVQIPRLGVSPTTYAVVTVDSFFGNPSGRYIPLAIGEVLWYVPPLGSVYNTVGTFYVTQGWPTPVVDFDVPDTWIMVCMRNLDYPGSDSCSHIWGDGREQSYFIVASFLNGWSNYDTGQHGTAAWKKENGWVKWRGLIKGGTAGVAMISLDATYNGNQEHTQTDGRSPTIVYTDTGAGRVDTFTTSLNHSSGGVAYLSLNTIMYWNG